jgi:NADPH2:quinone reductase
MPGIEAGIVRRMRAVRCNAWGPPESLVIEELPSPQPSAKEILVEVRAASVNFPDVLIIQDRYQVKPTLPFTPGTELSGVVRAVGEKVHHLSVGDEVIAFVGQGAFADEAIVPAMMALPKPPEVSFEIAASFTLAFATSHHALQDRARLAPGETLLVLGAAGGVGLAAVEIGKAMGARVIAAASSEEKLALCRAHGADETIDYGTGAGGATALRERIKELTGGKGADVVYDPVGGDLAEPALSPGSRSTWRCSRAARSWVCSGVTSPAASRATTSRRCASCSGGSPRASCGPTCRRAIRSNGRRRRWHRWRGARCWARS